MKLLEILEDKVVAAFRDRILRSLTAREVERVGNASKTWGPVPSSQYNSHILEAMCLLWPIIL